MLMDHARNRGTKEYMTLRVRARVVGVREYAPGAYRVRVEPTEAGVAAIASKLTADAGWKQPGEGGQNRFSHTVTAPEGARTRRWSRWSRRRVRHPGRRQRARGQLARSCLAKKLVSKTRSSPSEAPQGAGSEPGQLLVAEGALLEGSADSVSMPGDGS